MDPVEELRKAIVAKDLDRAATLIGPVWNERDGLRRMLVESSPGTEGQGRDERTAPCSYCPNEQRRDCVEGRVPSDEYLMPCPNRPPQPSTFSDSETPDDGKTESIHHGRRAFTDEDVEAGARALATRTGNLADYLSQARAVLDAVSKRADSEARAAGYVPLSEVVGFVKGIQMCGTVLTPDLAAYAIEREFSDRWPSAPQPTVNPAGSPRVSDRSPNPPPVPRRDLDDDESDREPSDG